MNFGGEEKVDIKDFSDKSRSFSTHEVDRKMIFTYYLQNFPNVLRTEKDDLSVIRKTIG